VVQKWGVLNPKIGKHMGGKQQQQKSMGGREGKGRSFCPMQDGRNMNNQGWRETKEKEDAQERMIAGGEGRGTPGIRGMKKEKKEAEKGKQLLKLGAIHKQQGHEKKKDETAQYKKGGIGVLWELRQGRGGKGQRIAQRPGSSHKDL